VADGARPHWIVADGAQHGADRRTHDAQRNDDAYEVPECEKSVEQQLGFEMDRGEAEVERGGRHAGQSVLAARIGRQRIEFDEVEHLCDRHGDHGEIDAGASERDQPHDVTDHAGRDHADHYRGRHIREVQNREQVGRDHAASAEEGGLAEREQAGEAEQDVEADAE
jgi:hypothetical protein